MTKRSDGLWQEKVRLKSGKYRYFYGRTKAEILRKISEFTEEKERGRLFSETADEWWVSHCEHLAYNTQKSYKPALIRAKEYFKDRRIGTILPNDISRHIRKFSRVYADKTVRTQLMVYNLIFKYAVEEGDILLNPARDLSIPADLPKKKISAPSSADIARVKNSTNCTFGLFALMALYTGMRRGELLALTWKDVDITLGMIVITKSVYHINNKPFVKPPKTTKSVGAVPILNALIPHLKPTTGLVFPNNSGGLLTETQFQRQWELYCRESGVECTPHQLRHAYATMLFENNIPPEEAQILLRHAQLSTTMDIYTDIREEKQNAVYAKVRNCDIV